MNYKKILKIIETIIIALLTTVALLVAVSMLPLERNYKIFVVKSGSMEPAIDMGSVAVVVPSSNYKVGDVITFFDPNDNSSKNTVTHRIYAISTEDSDEDFYVTKGDANDAPDSAKIKKERIVGKYLFNVPLIGYLLGYIKTLTGLVLIIIIPATLIIYEEFRKLRKEASAVISNRKNRVKKQDNDKVSATAMSVGKKNNKNVGLKAGKKDKLQ